MVNLSFATIVLTLMSLLVLPASVNSQNCTDSEGNDKGLSGPITITSGNNNRTQMERRGEPGCACSYVSISWLSCLILQQFFPYFSISFTSPPHILII